MVLGMKNFDFAKSNQIFPNLITFAQISPQFCRNLIKFIEKFDTV